ncbi:MAG: GNAT family N-acetyltransferase [Clostridiaceae bacterium]
MVVISLKKNNLSNFKKLNSKRSDFNSMNLDFFDTYNAANVLKKMFYRKYVRILKKEDKLIGYIWEKPLLKSLYKIQSLYLDKDNITKENILRLIGNKNKDYILYYKGEAYILDALNDIGFNFRNKTLILSIDLKDRFNESREGISYKSVTLGKDEDLRCKIQNKIFNNKNRIPLTIDDIYYDELQKYYYNEGAIFIQLNNKIIGYGQIIIDNKKPYIVNFGILDEYKGKGFGRIFLHHLLNLIIDEGFSVSLIKVDKENIKAVNLYKSTGFKEIEENYILETRCILEDS